MCYKLFLCFVRPLLPITEFNISVSDECLMQEEDMLTRKFGDLPVNGNAKVRPAIGKLLIMAGCKTKLSNPKSKR